MPTKIAIAIMVFLAIAAIVGVNFAGAQVYTPLVQISGLPPGGAVNLSIYLVGLYDFLLSIVGIAAVMMPIIGGMRYITAAGNQAAVSDAKDIITNALAGLLLAILSWIVVAEINPDVLHIKKPGGSFVDTPSADLGSCGTWDFATSVCTCKDGNVLNAFESVGVIDQNTCDFACKTFKHYLLPESNPCIANGASNDANDYNGLCQCIDGEDVKPVNSGTSCNTVCSVPAEAGTYDDGKGPAGEYHGINFVLRIGEDSSSLRKMPDSGFTVVEDVPMVYDFSQTEDCRYRIVEIAIDFDNLFPGPRIADNWCCKFLNPGCNLLSWGQLCDTAGHGRLCDDDNILQMCQTLFLFLQCLYILLIIMEPKECGLV